MATLPPYSTGLATVGVNGTTVTIPTAVLSDANARELDTFVNAATGETAFIRARVDATHLTVDPWKGAAMTSAPYRIERTSPLRFAGAEAQATVVKFVDYLNTLTIIIPVAGAAPDDSIGEEGWYALKSNGGGWKLWLKSGGVWVMQGVPAGLSYRGEWSNATAYLVNDRVSRNGTSFTAKQNNTNHDPATDGAFAYWDAGGSKGDKGDKGDIGNDGPPGPVPIIAATSSSTTIASFGLKDFLVPAGLSFGAVARVRIATGSASIVMLGLVGGYSGTTLTIYVDEIVAGAGQSGSTWYISLTGDRGLKGDAGQAGPGAVVTGSSTSVVSVGTGNKTFIVPGQPQWSVGQRLRAINAGGDRVLVGRVTGYSGTSLTLNVDSVQGVGSDSTWSLAIAGENGQQGGAGPSGATGQQGPIGPKGDTGAASTVPGPKGDTGAGLTWNASGTLAQRSIYDGSATGFAFLQTDVSPFRLWVKASNTSADWAGPTYMGGASAVGDWGLITDTITEFFDYGSIAA